MNAFSSIDIARTGLGFAHSWIDTVAHNVANLNTVRPADEGPFRARLVVARELQGDAAGAGVTLDRIVEADDAAPIVFDPDNPAADAQGNVALPVVDLAAQMTDLMVANRSYQANARTLQSAREAYESALRLGQSR